MTNEDELNQIRETVFNDKNSLIKTYDTLGKIAIAKPELAEQVLDTVKTALQSDKNDQYSLYKAYDILAEIATAQPEHSTQVIDTFKTILNSEIKNDNLLYDTYDALGDIAIAKPKLSEQVFEMFRTVLKSDKNDYLSLSSVYKKLDYIAYAKPELSKQVLETYKTALQSDKNNWTSLARPYRSLTEFVKANPELSEQVFETYKTALQSDKNNLDTLKKAYSKLGEIINSAPELSEQVFEMYKTALQSDKNNMDFFREAFISLTNIAEFSPQSHQKILEIGLDCYSSHPEFNTDQNQAENNDYDNQSRVETSITNNLAQHHQQLLLMLSKCLKTVQIKNLGELSPMQSEILQAAHRIRFSTFEELKYITSKFFPREIAAMNFPAQQRCMNILVGSLGKEQNIPEAETIAYRKNEANCSVYSINIDWLVPASFKASELFGCYFPAFLKKTQGYFSTHDAVYWLPKPMSPKKNDSFARFIQNNMIYADIDGVKKARPLSELSIISQNWQYLEPEQEKYKYKDLLALCKSRKYPNQEFGKFAEEAAHWGVNESDYNNFESIYKAGLKVPEPFDSRKEFKFGKYTGRFLPRNDVRTGFFGEHTDCCQHFGGMGHSCAVSTVLDDYSQLFVIENEKGNIIGGSWVWQNTEGKHREVCFDNIEAIGEYASNPLVNKIYDQVGRYLAEEENCRRVTIGLGYQDADVRQYKDTEAIPLPSRYKNNYSDAQSQVLLAENPQAKPLDKTRESLRYIRDVCFLDINAMDTIAEKCFPEGDGNLQVPDNLSGMALVDEDKGVVGYCLYDKKEKSIYDMAVLPEYRKDKNGSSTKLFGEIIRRVKELGGEWTAELRDKTAFRFMEAMQKRGLVQMENEGVDHTMNDGSKVFSVKFKPVTPPQKQPNIIMKQVQKLAQTI